jgi:protein-tyrosine-phosphatase
MFMEYCGGTQEAMLIEKRRKKQVIVVCTGNICRSPMAEGLLKRHLAGDLGGAIEVTSAGTHALQNHPAQDRAVEVMSRIGIDIGGHRARQLTREMARSADLILAMEMAHLWFIQRWEEIPQKTLHLFLEFDPTAKSRQVADPYGGPLSGYQVCLDTLRPAAEGVVRMLDSMVT